METLRADLRQALRGMRGNPGFTLTAVAALALGIGANTAIFSVVNAVILRPLPYAQPDRLVAINRSFKENDATAVSIPKFIFWKENASAFESMAAYDGGGPGLNLSSGSTPEQVQGAHASLEFFRVFGASPALGRTFSAAEDQPHGPRVAVLSYHLWSHRFGSEPKILGSSIDLSGQPYTVIGVMPSSFAGPTEADVWLPLQADPASNNQAHYLRVAARLKPGMTVTAANEQLKAVAQAFRGTHSKAIMEADEGIRSKLLQEQIVGDVRPALLVLVAAVCFVLLIACANMANLLLARAATRQRELAIRSAIGASRMRLVRQMLTESVFLSLIGSLFGLLLGVWGVRALLQVSPGQIPRVKQLIEASPLAFLDWRVFLYALGVALLTGVVFGLFPALRFSNPDLNGTLKEASSRSGTGLRQNRVRSVLVVAEVALAIVLLMGAGLLIRTFSGLRTVSTGLDVHNVLTFQTSMVDQRYQNTAAIASLERRVIEKLETTPGITAASATWMLPLNSNLDLPFNILGRTPSKDNPYDGSSYWRPVEPHFFAVFRIPLLRGRTLQESDTATSQPVVVINEVLAKQFWPKDNPVGKQIVIGKGIGPQFEDPPRTIVGVVGGQREDGLSRPMAGVIYLPFPQVSDAIVQFANPLTPRIWVVRAAGNAATYGNAVREALRSVDAKLPISKMRTMDEVLGEYTERENFNMLLLSIFAGIALALAAVGIFGLISYTVEQRTQEIGIRVALGARQMDTLQMVGRQMGVLLGVGIVVGSGIAFAVTRYMGSLLFEVKPWDPVTLSVVVGTLSVVALLATALPARRAMRVDPVIALRYE